MNARIGVHVPPGRRDISHLGAEHRIWGLAETALPVGHSGPPAVGEVGAYSGRMAKDRMKVGILGGTFDPPHLGHLAIANAVRDALDLDEVLLIVANVPWQKVGDRLISAAADRLAMVQEAVAGHQGLRASSVEIERGGPSYTLDTLRELHRSEPSHSHFLVLGADAAGLVHTWHRHEELPGLATLVIVDRPGSTPEPDPVGWEVVHVPGPGLEVSSSMVREALAAGDSVDHLVPAMVLAQIRRRGLYDAGRS